MSLHAILALVAASCGVHGVSAQSSFSLGDFISIAESLATELQPASKTASQTKSTSHSTSHQTTKATTAPSTLATMSTSQPASSTVEAASATGTPASQASVPAAAGGLDPRTRTIIIAVCVVVGLLLLALLLLLLCRRRRRNRDRSDAVSARRQRRHGKSRAGCLPWLKRKRGGGDGSQDMSTAIAQPGGWEKYNSHYGYDAAIVGGAESHHYPRESTISQQGLLSHQQAEAGRHSLAGQAPSNEHSAFRHSAGSTDSYADNPFVPSPPPARKPLPTNRHNHHSGALAAAGAGLGMGAMYKHHQHNKEAKEADARQRAFSPGAGHSHDGPRNSASPGGGFSGLAGTMLPRGHDENAYQQVPLGPYADESSGAPRRRSYEEGFDDSRYSHQSHRSDQGAVPLAAGAFAGAAAQRERSHSAGNPVQVRPPTPLGFDGASSAGPTAAQRRSLQDREALAPGMAEQSRPAPTKKRVSFSDTSSSSSSSSPRRSSGARVPTAAVGAVAHNSPRVLAPAAATSPLAHAMSPEQAAPGHSAGPVRPSVAQMSTTDSSGSTTSFYSARQAVGVPSPLAWGSAEQLATPVPAHAAGGGRRASKERVNGYSPISEHGEYDPFARESGEIGSGRRSLGERPSGSGGPVRLSGGHGEWGYGGGDDYSDRGGGGGNVYDGYKYGTV